MNSLLWEARSLLTEALQLLQPQTDYVGRDMVGPVKTMIYELITRIDEENRK